MKLRIDQKHLAEAANRAHRQLRSNPLQPVLAGLLLQATAEQATLSGFDLDTSTCATLDAEIFTPGETVVSGRLLSGVATSLPAGPVDLTVDERSITVTAPGIEFHLPTMNRSDYPALPVPPGTAGTVDGNAFATAVGHVATTTLPEKEAVGSMASLAGVHVAAEGNHLIVSGTDRYRISQHTVPWTPDHDTNGELLLPATGLAAAVKQMTGGPLRIGFPAHSDSVAALTCDRLTVTSRTITGKLPDISRFFPDSRQAEGSAVFSAEELLTAVKRAALVGEPKDPVRLSISDGRIEVHGGAGDASGRSRVAADTDLTDCTIIFNPGYIASLLTPVAGSVRMWLTTPTKPALIEPADSSNYRAVCMPIRP